MVIEKPKKENEKMKENNENIESECRKLTSKMWRLAAAGVSKERRSVKSRNDGSLK
jgi:hypothetical protein